MAAAGAQAGLTVLTGIISLVESSISLANAINPPSKSIVRIAAGQQGPDGGCYSCDGNIPKLFAWNIRAQPIGRFWRGPTAQSILNDGAYVDLSVDQGWKDADTEQPIWLTVQADGDDALCMAYVAHTWPDGTKKAFLGDMAYACHQAWAYSNVFVQTSDGSQFKPKCAWIDGNGDSSIHKGITIDMTKFSNAGDGTKFDPPTGQTLCTSPNLHWYSNIKYNNDAVPIAATRKRSRIEYQKRSYRTFDGRIIASSDPSHSAKLLCESSSSWSPDFVSFVESLFCDMNSRLLWPLCSTDNTEGCFDWELKTLVEGKHQKRASPYSNVTIWE